MGLVRYMLDLVSDSTVAPGPSDYVNGFPQVIDAINWFLHIIGPDVNKILSRHLVLYSFALENGFPAGPASPGRIQPAATTRSGNNDIHITRYKPWNTASQLSCALDNYHLAAIQSTMRITKAYLLEEEKVTAIHSANHLRQGLYNITTPTRLILKVHRRVHFPNLHKWEPLLHSYSLLEETQNWQVYLPMPRGHGHQR